MEISSMVEEEYTEELQGFHVQCRGQILRWWGVGVVEEKEDNIIITEKNIGKGKNKKQKQYISHRHRPLVTFPTRQVNHSNVDFLRTVCNLADLCSYFGHSGLWSVNIIDSP